MMLKCFILRLHGTFSNRRLNQYSAIITSLRDCPVRDMILAVKEINIDLKVLQGRNIIPDNNDLE